MVQPDIPAELSEPIPNLKSDGAQEGCEMTIEAELATNERLCNNSNNFYGIQAVTAQEQSKKMSASEEIVLDSVDDSDRIEVSGMCLYDLDDNNDTMLLATDHKCTRTATASSDKVSTSIDMHVLLG